MSYAQELQANQLRRELLRALSHIEDARRVMAGETSTYSAEAHMSVASMALMRAIGSDDLAGLATTLAGDLQVAVSRVMESAA